MRGTQARDYRGDQTDMRTVNPSELLSEAAIQRQILDLLKLKGIFAWKASSTGIYDQKRGAFRKNPHTVGVADIIAIFDYEHDSGTCGQFWAIECKSSKGKLSAAQESFRASVILNGGKYTLAYSVDDVIKALEGK